MRTRLFAALAVVVVPAVALLVPASDARGQDDSAPAPSKPASPARDGGAAKRYDPDNKTAISEWMEKCIAGNVKLLANDAPGAVDMYRQAIQLAPKQPLPRYLLAEAQIAAGNLADAEGDLKTAETNTKDSEPEVRGKVLFLLSDVYEREKKWPDAKAAWATYTEFAAKHADAGAAPGTPTARIQAIDAMLKQDTAYEVVRQRIQAERDEAAKSGDAGAPKK